MSSHTPRHGSPGATLHRHTPMAETTISDDPLGGIDAMIDRATAAHDADPEGLDHAQSWCLVCWAVDHADEIAAMERATPADPEALNG